MNVDDLASAIIFLLTKKSKTDYLNIGSGEQVSINTLAIKIKKIVKYDGKIFFNTSYPDGVKKRQVDSHLIRELGWKPKINLDKGLAQYCLYYINNVMPKEKIK